MSYQHRHATAMDFGSDRWKKESSYENLEVVRASAEIRAEMREEISRLRSEISELQFDLLRWMFGAFWFATMLGLFALGIAIARR